MVYNVTTLRFMCCSVNLSHVWVTKDGTQIVRLWSRCLYLLSHRACSNKSTSPLKRSQGHNSETGPVTNRTQWQRASLACLKLSLTSRTANTSINKCDNITFASSTTTGILESKATLHGKSSGNSWPWGWGKENTNGVAKTWCQNGKEVLKEWWALKERGPKGQLWDLWVTKK